MDALLLQEKLRQIVLAEAKKLVQESGLLEPPFSTASLVGKRPIKILPARLGTISGLLIPGEDGFIVKVNITDPPERQSYSCAHEIAHTFFYSEEAQKLALALRALMGSSRYKKFEETLCDRAAADLLMPEDLFFRCASRYEFGIMGLVALAKKFEVSVQAAAIRIGQVCPKPCKVLFVKWDPKEEKLEPRVVSPLKARTPKGEAHILSLKAIKDPESPWHKAYWSASPEPSYFDQVLSFGRFRRLHRIECQVFGSGERRLLVALAFQYAI